MRVGAALLGLLFGAVAGAAPYRLEEIPLPAEMSPEISAVQFSPTGRLVVANRHGEVWSCDPAKQDWRRFAHGLHEPMGLLVLADDHMLAAQRPELTRLRDADGDGVADRYETVSAGWGVTDNWHEFTLGPVRDHAGNFYVSLALPDTSGSINLLHASAPTDISKVLREAKPSLARWQGWVLKITPAGELLPWASGFRQGTGIGVSPDGEVFITDQQGDYVAASPLIHVQPGHFYGHPASLKWDAGLDVRGMTIERLEEMRTPPHVVLPHGSMGGSPGDPVWDTTGGRFGPFAGQVFIGDFTKLISRVDLERVAGEYQGACFPFLRDATGVEAILSTRSADNLTVPTGRDGRRYFRDAPPLPGVRLRQGNNRLAFAPDGSLYIGQTARGWAYGDGLQRLVWTGAAPVEIRTLRLADDGFALEFTVPMNPAQLADAARYRLERFRYLYHHAYGSPRVDVAPVAVTQVTVNDDGRRVHLRLAELEPGFIYRLEVDQLVSATGQPIANPLAYYTLNRLRSGRTFAGPLGRPLNPVEPSAAGGAEPVNPETGRGVYLTFCVSCHQADGRGGGTPGFVAADFTGPASPLRKPDEALLAVIAGGIDGKAMPAFGQVLSVAEQRDVLAFLREAFGAQP